MRKFKVGDRVSISMYGGATGTVRGADLRSEREGHYRVEMDDKARYKAGYFMDSHGRGHYAIPEGEMALIEPPAPKFAVGDKVTWGGGYTGYVYQGTLPDGRHVLTDSFDISTGVSMGDKPYIGNPIAGPLRLVEPPKPKTRTVKVRTAIAKTHDGSETMSYSYSEDEPDYARMVAGEKYVGHTLLKVVETSFTVPA